MSKGHEVKTFEKGQIIYCYYPNRHTGCQCTLRFDILAQLENVCTTRMDRVFNFLSLSLSLCASRLIFICSVSCVTWCVGNWDRVLATQSFYFLKLEWIRSLFSISQINLLAIFSSKFAYTSWCVFYRSVRSITGLVYKLLPCCTSNLVLMFGQHHSDNIGVWHTLMRIDELSHQGNFSRHLTIVCIWHLC